MRGQFATARDEESAREFVRTYPDEWFFTDGRYNASFALDGTKPYNSEEWSVSPERGAERMCEGYWVYHVPVSLQPYFDRDGRPRAGHADRDTTTARLIYSAVPRYRNSDICPKPLCGKTMQFVQANLVCPIHGAHF